MLSDWSHSYGNTAIGLLATKALDKWHQVAHSASNMAGLGGT